MFAAAPLLGAQHLPDPKLLLQEAEIARKQYLSTQHNVMFQIEMVGQGLVASTGGTGLTASGGDGKLHVETSGDDFRLLVISDGSATWTYDPTQNQFARKPLSASRNYGSFSVLAGLPPGAARNLRTVRSESLFIDGTFHECWVIAGTLADLAFPDLGKMLDGSWTLWLDKARHVEIQSISSARLVIPQIEGPILLHTAIVTSDWTFDQVHDDLFHFDRPADAEQVESVQGLEWFPLDLGTVKLLPKRQR
jgi:hypothetical protein